MELKKIVVAGGGVLGSQIAYQSAYCGFDVTMWLRSDESIERSKKKLERLKNIYLKTLEEMKINTEAYCRGFCDDKTIPNEEIEKLKKRAIYAFDSLKMTTSYEEAAIDADLVIEAIAEDSKQKIALYQELQKYLPEKTIIATNSSTLLPSKLAEHTGRPEKFLALHFANNIWMENTAEIMGHSGTEQKYYDEVVKFAENINMIPLKLKKEQPAYILNSLLIPFLDAGLGLWANDVANPETIDLTWKLSTGAPKGPFEIIDVVGLTTVYNIGLMKENVHNPDSIEYKISKKIKEKIDAGELGINSGKGFYSYD